MIWLLLALLVAWVAVGPWVPVGVALLLLVPRVRWWVVDRVHVTRRAVVTGAAVVAVTAGLVVVVPDGWIPIPQSPGRLVTPAYVGRPATPSPVSAQEVPQHPHLAANGRSATHDDAWATDAYAWPGPIGLQPEVDTAWYGTESCATLTFDARDRLVAVCGDRAGPLLRVIDPDSMRTLATKDLPDPPDGEERCDQPPAYLDARDRAVLATADRRILAVRTSDADGEADLTTDRAWDLRPHVPEGDCLVALLPDWQGRIWWASREGLVGTVAPESGQVGVRDLEEGVTGSFAADQTGMYVVSDAALHRLVAGPDGAPQVAWRTAYDRGEGRRTGQLSRGSGTTPTLLDGGVVAIADNADPRMRVVLLDRATGREICAAAVFEEDAGATQGSLVSLGRGVVVVNHHGYAGPVRTLLGRATSPGLARVDLVGGQCRVTWSSDVVSPSAVAKASWPTGLVYAYTKRPTWWGVSAWYLTALDSGTGRTVWSVRTGTGMLMGNDRSAVTLAPDGAVWIATLAGLVRVRDRRSGPES